MEFLLVVPQWLVEMRTEKLLDNALHKCTCGVEPPLVRWPFPRQTLLEHKLQAICRGPTFMASLPRRFVTRHGRERIHLRVYTPHDEIDAFFLSRFIVITPNSDKYRTALLGLERQSSLKANATTGC